MKARSIVHVLCSSLRGCSSYAGVVMALSCAVTAAAEPVTSLHRKPGLWAVTVVAGGRKGPGVIQQCIDEATDAKMMRMASQAEGQNCSRNELTKDGSNYAFASECAISGSKVVSKGLFKGDFNSKYEGEVVTTFTPPLFGHAESKTTIVATWEGACPAGMSPGDMRLPNGMKMSLEQAEQSAKMASQMMNSPELANMMKGAMNNPAVRDAMRKMAAQGGE